MSAHFFNGEKDCVVCPKKICSNFTMPRINRSSTEIVTTASTAAVPSAELRKRLAQFHCRRIVVVSVSVPGISGHGTSRVKT
jgi:hypothetical protein